MHPPLADFAGAHTLETLRYLTATYLQAAQQVRGRDGTSVAGRFLAAAARTTARAEALGQVHSARLEVRLARAYAAQDEAGIVELETALGGLAMRMAAWPAPPCADRRN
ncbi:MAG TPA: hypothetical protein VII06_22645 [Chloroflexota bacterium]|jgi:hypothetical protein